MSDKPFPFFLDVDLDYLMEILPSIVSLFHPFFNGFPGHVNPSIQVNVCPRNQMKAKDCMHL